MRVAIDCSGLYVTQAGIARHIRGLLRGLATVSPADLEWGELAWRVTNFEYRQPARAFKTVYREWIWAQWLAPRQLRSSGATLLHSTGSFIIRAPRGIKNVVTLHDLAGLRHPDRFRRWHRHSERARLQRLREVDRVICVSRFTADEAMNLLGLSSKKLTVVYNGVDFTQEDPEHAPAEPLPQDYFLFVGSLEPGKNLSLLKAAYSLARERDKVLPGLVIVGARWAGVAGEGTPPAEWHYLGRQSDAVLIYLYRRAIALVFPSRYEGFGLPVVEAMGQGCPVICSRVASLPEVGGDAAVYADPTPADYLDAMLRLANDQQMCQELSARGRQQADRFSWSRCAEETVAVYRDAIMG